ncbi:MAG TPA: hypothetical protein VHM90_10205 [Phycisphaerae bacterium]|nr:hypothetical protein [Phycisphaerae bacterium]
MYLEARAPRIGFNLNLTTKNLIIVLMCLVFAGLFFYDGFYAYPVNNDFMVEQRIKPAINQDSALDFPDFLEHWKGWKNEPAENRLKMDHYVDANKTKIKGIDGWKSSTDINVQRWIASALVLVFIGALWRFIAGARLRVSATDTAVSPRAGLEIPWEKITKVDNTDWRSYGIVKITYTDASGSPATAEFDDYKTQREPLLKILDALGEKALHAEFVPKEEPPPPTPPANPPSETGATAPG